MKSQIAYALAHPVFDPERQITSDHFWPMNGLTFGLTVNIGTE